MRVPLGKNYTQSEKRKKAGKSRITKLKKMTTTLNTTTDNTSESPIESLIDREDIFESSDICRAKHKDLSVKKYKTKQQLSKPTIPSCNGNLWEKWRENKATEVGRFWSIDKPLRLEAIKLLSELISYYTNERLEKLIVPRAIKSLGLSKEFILSSVIKDEINGISLRAIEWLVTNYSKGTKIVLYNEEQKKHIDIHTAYEVQSNYYKRNLFDPFCRHGRIYFSWKLQKASKKTNSEVSGSDSDTSTLQSVVLFTTVGQLNFMKWAEDHGILGYAKAHQDEIQNTMEITLAEVNKEKKICKKMGQTRKRKELTKAPEILCTVYRVDTDFDIDAFASPTPSPTHSRTHSPTHSRTHSPTHSRTHSRTHSPIHSPTHSCTHSRTHSPNSSPTNKRRKV